MRYFSLERSHSAPFSFGIWARRNQPKSARGNMLLNYPFISEQTKQHHFFNLQQQI